MWTRLHCLPQLQPRFSALDSCPRPDVVLTKWGCYFQNSDDQITSGRLLARGDQYEDSGFTRHLEGCGTRQRPAPWLLCPDARLRRREIQNVSEFSQRGWVLSQPTWPYFSSYASLSYWLEGISAASLHGNRPCSLDQYTRSRRRVGSSLSFFGRWRVCKWRSRTPIPRLAGITNDARAANTAPQLKNNSETEGEGFFALGIDTSNQFLHRLRWLSLLQQMIFLTKRDCGLMNWDLGMGCEAIGSGTGRSV